jgi:hypothetical protein
VLVVGIWQGDPSGEGFSIYRCVWKREEHELSHSLKPLFATAVAREAGECLIDDAIAPVDPIRTGEMGIDERGSRDRAVDHVGVDDDGR